MPANHCVPHTPEAKAKIAIARKGIATHVRPIRIVNGVTLYHCGSCKKMLPRECFYQTKRNRIGIRSQCRPCHSECSIRSRDKSKARASKVISEAKRRALKAGAVGRISTKDLREIQGRYGSNCLACGSVERLTWDHIIPLSRGGAHCVSNLQCLCRRCNEKKQARAVDYRSDEQKLWMITFRKVE